MKEYPLLKSTARLKKLPAFCWATELLTDYGAVVAPFEAFLLANCTGTYDTQELARLFSGLLGWEATKAEAYVADTMRRLGCCVQMLPSPLENAVFAYDPREFLYSPVSHSVEDRYESPVEMVLVLTNRCNFRCTYCYNDSGKGNKADELTGEQWLQIVAQAKEMGVVKCTLTGGEPMLNPYFFDILQALLENGILPYICTNGSLIDACAVEKFRQLGQPFVQISMDSPFEAAHDRLTKAQGTLPKVKDGIRRLVEAGIRVHVKAVSLPETYQDVGPLIDECRKLGVSQLILDRYDLCYAGRGDNQFFLTPQQEEAIQAVVDERKSSIEDMNISTVFPPRNWTDEEDIVMCGAFLRSFAVMPNGDFPLCEKVAGVSALTVGNFNDMSLQEMWRSPRIAQILEPEKEQLHPTCRECEYLSNCATGCFATKRFFTDDLYAPDPNCWKAHYPNNPFQKYAAGVGGVQ